MNNIPKSDTSSDDDIKQIAKNLGVDLDDEGSGKTGNGSNPDSKMDTKPTEDGRSGELEKFQKRMTELEGQVAGSTKEFQQKYKPMEDNIKKLEQLSGKSIDDLLKDFEKNVTDKKDEDKNKKDTPKDVVNVEVDKKLSSLEEELGSIKEKIIDYDKHVQLTVKQKVDAFKSQYELSDDIYEKQIKPLLSGIKEMTKENGDLYTLEEGLELAYFITNRKNVDKIVDQKIKIKQKEVDLTFSPKGGSRESVSMSKPTYTEQQKDMARKMGINLEAEPESKK